MAPRWEARVRAGLPVSVSIVLCAYFLAHGATRLMAHGWLGKLAAEPVADVAPARREAGVDLRSGASDATQKAHAILARNIFDSETGALWPPPLTDVDDAPPSLEMATEQDAPLGRCEGSLRLVGTVFSGRDPERSLASLTHNNEKRVLYPGMEFEGHRLDAVFPSTVLMRKASDDTVCTLSLFVPDASGDAKVASAPKPEKKKKKKNAASKRRNAGLADDEIDRHVQRLGEHRYRVDRVLVDQLLSNRAGLMGIARVRPVRNSGGVTGVRLLGFKTDDLLGKLGLRAGDTLRTINGFAMGSPDAALEAYVNLKQADRLTLSVLRKGKPITIEYAVH